MAPWHHSTAPPPSRIPRWDPSGTLAVGPLRRDPLGGTPRWDPSGEVRGPLPPPRSGALSPYPVHGCSPSMSAPWQTHGPGHGHMKLPRRRDPVGQRGVEPSPFGATRGYGAPPPERDLVASGEASPPIIGMGVPPPGKQPRGTRLSPRRDPTGHGVARLHGARLHGVRQHGVRLHGVRLHGVRLHGVGLHGVGLHWV